MKFYDEVYYSWTQFEKEENLYTLYKFKKYRAMEEEKWQAYLDWLVQKRSKLVQVNVMYLLNAVQRNKLGKMSTSLFSDFYNTAFVFNAI